jgi:hypothetical protein
MSTSDDCADVLATLARGATLDEAGERHRRSCMECAALADDLAVLGRALVALPPPLPPHDLDDRVLRAATPLLAAHARAATDARAATPERIPAALAEHVYVRPASSLDGRRLARALVPAILLFPLLVVADVWLLRLAHETLAAVLPRPLTTYFVLSYATLLAALGCLVFGAIPLLVERQAALLVWKEEHV